MTAGGGRIAFTSVKEKSASAMENLFYKWLIEAVLGLLLTGFGLSLFGQSVIYKARGAPLKKWFLSGTLSLIVFNAGLCVFGDAVKTRLIYEQTGDAPRSIDNWGDRAAARAPSATASPVLRKQERALWKPSLS